MSSRTPHVLAIPGSTREHSTHKALLRTIAVLAEGQFTLELYEGIGTLPHFNPDVDGGQAPVPVAQFREKLRATDGVLICTPEYAMGVPGTLKNALDWTVSTADLYKRPAALITASSQGYKGHAALMETLRILDCILPAGTDLIIPFIKTKVAADGSIKHSETLGAVTELIGAFHASMNEHRANP